MAGLRWLWWLTGPVQSCTLRRSLADQRSKELFQDAQRYAAILSSLSGVAVAVAASHLQANRAANLAQGSTPALLTLAVESPSGERTVEVMLDNAGAPVSVKVRRQLAARS